MCRLINTFGYGSGQPVSFTAKEKDAALTIVAHSPSVMGGSAAARQGILP